MNEKEFFKSWVRLRRNLNNALDEVEELISHAPQENPEQYLKTSLKAAKPCDHHLGVFNRTNVHWFCIKCGITFDCDPTVDKRQKESLD